jgi:hypothetical protein
VWCGRVQCLGARPTLKYNPMGQPFGLHSGPGEGISGRRYREERREGRAMEDSVNGDYTAAWGLGVSGGRRHKSSNEMSGGCGM